MKTSVSGESEASSGYRPAKLAAGDYRLEWSTDVLAFSVPENVTLELRVRTTESGAERLVFSTTAGVELVVDPSQLSTDAAQNAALFPDVTDQALSTLAGTLRLSLSTAEATAEVTEEITCVAVDAPVTGSATVDLDASTCGVVRGGGSVTVSHEGRTLSATLATDRDWLVLSAKHAEDAEFEALWFVDLESGAALALSPLDGSEVDRQVGTGDAAGAARLDAIASSAAVP